MIDDTFMQEYLRAKVEQRMKPMLRLRTRQFRLVTFAFVFMLLTFLLVFFRGTLIYNLVMPLFWLSFALGLFAVIRFSIDYQHENAVQKEMKHEMEMERLRLLHDLAFGRASEKHKNRLSLSDDGELAADDENPDKPLRKHMRD